MGEGEGKRGVGEGGHYIASSRCPLARVRVNSVLPPKLLCNDPVQFHLACTLLGGVCLGAGVMGAYCQSIEDSQSVLLLASKPAFISTFWWPENYHDTVSDTE